MMLIHFVLASEQFLFNIHLSRSYTCIMGQVMRNLDFCICETDQLQSKSEISSLRYSVAVQPDLCQTWSEILKTSFLMMLLIRYMNTREETLTVSHKVKGDYYSSTLLIKVGRFVLIKNCILKKLNDHQQGEEWSFKCGIIKFTQMFFLD